MNKIKYISTTTQQNLIEEKVITSCFVERQDPDKGKFYRRVSHASCYRLERIMNNNRPVITLYPGSVHISMVF